MRTIALLGTVLPALSACGRQGVAPDDHLDAIPDLVVEADLRLGNVEDPDSGFSQVFSADVDRDGNIYVQEASVPEIRVFDPDGALIRRFGRRGEGPGEFRGATRFGVVGDTVWALPFAPDRIVLFDRGGDLLSDRRVEEVVVPLPVSYAYVVPSLMRPDGRFASFLSRVAFIRDAPPTGVQATDSIPVPFVLFDAAGAVADTIGWTPRPPPRMWNANAGDRPQLRSIEVGSRRVWVPSPPPTDPWWLPLRDGYVVVETPVAEDENDAAFTVTRFGAAGDTVFRRTLHYRPGRYSAADLDTIAVRAARGEAGGGVPYSPDGSAPADWEAAVPRLRDAMSYPEFKLPIDYPWIAQDDAIWLRLSDSDPTATRWLVLDGAGRVRGRLELPPRSRMLWANGDRFMTAEPDELDIPWVVRYRILPGSR